MTQSEFFRNMAEEKLKAMRDLDELAEKSGGYVAFERDAAHYNYRKIIQYCKEKGIEPIDLTIRELRNFVLK